MSDRIKIDEAAHRCFIASIRCTEMKRTLYSLAAWGYREYDELAAAYRALEAAAQAVAEQAEMARKVSKNG